MRKLIAMLLRRKPVVLPTRKDMIGEKVRIEGLIEQSKDREDLAHCNELVQQLKRRFAHIDTMPHNVSALINNILIKRCELLARRYPVIE